MRILSVFNAGADTDRFLVQDGTGAVKFRTGAEVASDIGAANIAASQLRHTVKAAVALTKGQAVYVSGADGTNMLVSKSSNVSESTSTKTMGLIDRNLAINDMGEVITEGLLAGLNTSTATIGDPVWLGVDGNLSYGVANKPVAPAHMVFIGIVTRVQTNNGEIFVKVQNGFELEELHNVLITGTPVDKAVIQYDTASGLWKNSTLGGVTASTGTAGQVPYFTGATTQAGSNNLFWDNTNVRLGIGTNTPNSKLEVYSPSGYNVIRSVGGSGGYFEVYSAGGIRQGSFGSENNGDTYFGTRSSNPLIFITNGTEKARFHATGNFSIGTISDLNYKLQVIGDTLLRGSGNTSGTTVLTVQNSDSANLFRVRNDGVTLFGSFAENGRIYPSDTNGNISINGPSLTIEVNNTGSGAFFLRGGTQVLTGGTLSMLNVTRTFAPTSGAATFTTAVLNPVINQVGATGITRGLYVNPTLTAAADWRSIEWSNNTGWGLYGAGTANNHMAGSLGIGSTSLSSISLRVSKNIAGSAASYGIWQDGIVQADVTGNGGGFINQMQTIASLNLTSYYHYRALEGTIGASTTLANQFGFHVANLTTGTYRYGFYSNVASASNVYNFYANGTAENYFNGNVLIGNNISSSEKLQVTGTSKFTSDISLISSANAVLNLDALSTNTAALIFKRSGTEAGRIAFSNSANMIFHTGSAATQRMVIDGSTGAVSVVNNFAVDTNTLFVDATANRVGIGTTNPSYTFHAISADGTIGAFRNSGAALGQLLVGNTAGDMILRILATGDSLIYSDTAKYLAFGSNGGTERMRIDVAGNVGIGTTNVVSKLTVSGIGDATGVTLTLMNGGNISAQNDPLGIIDFYSNDTSIGASGSKGNIALRNEFGGHWDGNLIRENTYFSFSTSSSRTVSEKMRIASSGAIRLFSYGTGVNTGTVAYNLAVDASGNIIETAGGVVDGSGTANYIPKWQDANTLTNSLIFDNGTNVGIGTASPVTKLDVSGAIATASPLLAHQTARGVFEYNAGKVAIRAYGDTSGSGFIAFNTGGGGGSADAEAVRITQFGNVLVGITGITNVDLMLRRNVTHTGGTAYSVYSNSVFQSGATNVSVFASDVTTQASAFTITNFRHFNAYAATLGAGSSITNQYGFVVSNAMTAATNNYGFYGDIASGTGRWNLYMNGNAANYLAGSLSVGTTANNTGYITNYATIPVLALQNPTTGTATNDGFQFSVSGSLAYIWQYENAAMLFGTNATERMRLDASGNLGIGLSDPSAKLHITGEVKIGGDNGAAFTRLTRINFVRSVYDPTGVGASIDFYREGSGTEGALAFSTNPGVSGNNAAERIRILATGNVGIGTSTPSSTLHISKASSTFQITDTAKTANNTLSIYALTQTVWAIGTGTSGTLTNTEKIVFSDGGNVGIGASNPTAKLHIIGTESRFGGVASGFISLYNATNRSGYIQANQAVDLRIASDTDPMTFYVGGSERMRIDTSGNLGLGITAPEAKMHISGAMIIGGASTIGLQLENALTAVPSSNVRSIIANTSSSIVVAGALLLQPRTGVAAPILFYTEGAEKMRLASNGNLLIGSTSDTTERLQVTGDGVFKSNTNTILTINSNGGTALLRLTTTVGTQAIRGGIGGTNNMVFETNSTERMRLDASGYLGIGTATPKRHLDVSTTGSPEIVLGALSGGVDQKYWRMYAASDIFRIGNVNDAFSSGTDVLAINRSNNVGIGTTSINTSAKLQVDSTTQGFLPPRMTSTQRSAISSPSIGLVVYQTDGVEGLYIYTNANGWKSLAIVN